MHIVIITQEDIFYIPIFLKRFIELINKEDIHLKAVFILPSFNKKFLDLIKQLYYFYGPVGFLRQSFRYLMLKFLDKIHLKTFSVSSILSQNKISIEHIDDVNNKSFLEKLRNLKPDVILSVAASQKFSEELLQIPEKYCINVHCSKLPKYRGMMPNFWAMYYDEEKTAVTIHVMDKFIDKGKIVLQEEVEINQRDSLEDLIKKTKYKSADLAVKCLKEIKAGSVQLRDYKGDGSYFQRKQGSPPKADGSYFRRKQGSPPKADGSYFQRKQGSPPKADGSYFSFPTKEHVRIFRQKGKKIL